MLMPGPPAEELAASSPSPDPPPPHPTVRALTAACGSVPCTAAVRWYRSPEVLIGFERPSPAIDMWSLGCILVELRTSSALLPAKPGDDELCNLMNMMEELLGSVPYEMVVASSLGIELEATLNVRSSVAPCRSLHDVIAGNEDFPLGVHPSWSPGECDLLLDLVTDLLKYRPCQRLTPAEAAKHGFFRPSTSLSDFEGA